MQIISTKYIKICALIFLAALLYVECFINHNKDFDIFIAASKLVSSGRSCYNVWLHSGTSGLKYFYSPLFAVLLFPIKNLSQTGYYLVWLSVNILLVYRIFKMIPYFLNINKMEEKEKMIFYLLTILLCLRAFHDTFSLGQMTIVLVWGSMESMRLINNKNTLIGCGLLALIINVKLIPIALLIYFIYKKMVKETILTILFLAFYILLPSLFIGFDFNLELHKLWFEAISNTNSNSLMDDYGRQSLSSFIGALFMKTPIQFNLKRNLFDLSIAEVSMILNLCRLMLLIILVYLFGKPLIKINTPKILFFDLALVCLVTPLFFPHQGKYSFFYLLPAQSYCVYSLIRIKKISGKNIYKTLFNLVVSLVSLSFALLALTTDGLIGRHLSNLLEYCNCYTFGTIILLIAMAFLKPKRLII